MKWVMPVLLFTACKVEPYQQPKVEYLVLPVRVEVPAKCPTPEPVRECYCEFDYYPRCDFDLYE
jgi:hypothetical protein